MKSDIERIMTALLRLGDIADCTLLEVTENRKTDAWSTEVDIVVYGEFRDEKALAAFRAHPIYSEVTRDVRPLRELRIADHVTSSARANCTPAP